MAAKRNTPAPVQSGAVALWEKYGTWVTGAIAAALAVVLAVTLYNRHREKRITEGRGELAAVNASDVLADQKLRQLLAEYDYPALTPEIKLRLAQVLLTREEYDQAEPLLNELSENKSLSVAQAAMVHLAQAYAAQGLGQYEEAKRRWDVVVGDKLYAFEAARNLAVIEEAMKKGAKAPAPEAPAVGPPAPAPAVPPTPMPPVAPEGS